MNWGIIGLGRIAHKFVQDLQLVDGSHIASAASRNIEKAKAFAEGFKIPKSYGSYSELFQDDEVDIVYIATPHDSHMAICIEAMKAGKHVLCEKPLAVNSTQVKLMIEASRENKVFLMEALWSRFMPVIKQVRKLIDAGEIGEVNYVNVDFSYLRDDPDQHRLMNINLAGGSLLDMGIYPVFLAYLMMGVPNQIAALGRMSHTGVDEQVAAVFKYDNGIANVMSGFRSQSEMCARIYGSAGAILIDPVWHHSSGYTIMKNGEEKHFSLPPKGRGFTHEIEECQRCIFESKIESELWSHQDSLNLMNLLDEIRAQINLKYPFE